MSTFEKNLENYAELVVRTGVNIQPGQTLVINAPLPALKLVREIAKKAYAAGAKNVHVEWNDEVLEHIKFKSAPDEAFTEYPAWKAKGYEDLAYNGAAFLTIKAVNPDLMSDVDPKRVAAANKANLTAMRNYRTYVMADKACWCVISVPTPEWAVKVFPNSPAEEAYEQFWDIMFKITRADKENPIEAWKEHNARLWKIKDYLNEKQYKELVYEAEGTKLTIALPENHIWGGGAAVSAQGVQFNPNIPTEEVFTMPHKDGANGVVSSKKPLNYGGTLIENFTLTFKEGKVVDFTAEKGYDTLKHLLDTDEGSRRLGEVALVPHNSPISQSNLIFFNTLYDENAASHLALGRAYTTNIEGGVDMTEEQLAEHGVNTSLVHVDFMIGSADMKIDGITKDGKREPIIRNGDWAL